MTPAISLNEIDKSFLKSLKELEEDIDRLHGCGICSYLLNPFWESFNFEIRRTAKRRTTYLAKKAAKACDCYNPYDDLATEYFIEGCPEETPAEAYRLWYSQRILGREKESTTDNPLILNRKKIITWLIGYLETLFEGEAE